MKVEFADAEIERDVRARGDIIVGEQMVRAFWRMSVCVDGKNVSRVRLIDFARGVAHKYVVDDSGKYRFGLGQHGERVLHVEAFSLANATISFTRRPHEG